MQAGQPLEKSRDHIQASRSAAASSQETAA